MLLCVLQSAQSLFAAAPELEDRLAARFVEEGFANVRFSQDAGYKVYTIEPDSYKHSVDALRAARELAQEECGGEELKIIVTSRGIPELTMTYRAGQWTSTKSLDTSWKSVRSMPKAANSFGKIDIVVYPQISLKNLIINQIYQALWQLSPAVEVSLLPGMKFSYQLKLPIYNDGFSANDGRVHPGMITLSQRFRMPGNFNLYGKFTAGIFNSNRYGLALEMCYYLPNERFSVDTQLGLLRPYYWNGFEFFYDQVTDFYWNASFNYFQPSLQTLFSLKAQKFVMGDIGLKYEMQRMFHRCTVSLYAEKGKYSQLNVGFRFQIALPPYKHKRHGYIPRLTTSSYFGMSYVANNEQLYYREYRTEASDNIMSVNAYNPFYIECQLSQ